LSKPFYLRFSRGGRGVSIPVLMYHNLHELDESATEGKRTWTVSPDAFAAQMTYLAEQGWHSISPQQMADYFDSGAPLPPKSIIISMDDGYKEVYTVAYPIFVKTGLRPLLFIVLKYVGFPAYLDWPQLEELVAHGFMVGSHSYDHSNLRQVDDDALEEQIGGSKDQLVERLGVTIDAFCYPYGSYETLTASIA